MDNAKELMVKRQGNEGFRLKRNGFKDRPDLLRGSDAISITSRTVVGFCLLIAAQLLQAQDTLITWGPERRMTNNIRVDEFQLGIWAQDSCIHAFYDDTLLQYYRSGDYGTTWASPVQLTTDPRVPIYNQWVALADTNVYVAWIYNTDSFRVGFRRSPDRGRSWGPIQSLVAAEVCGVTGKGDTVFVCFFRRNTPQTTGIWLAKSFDAGTSWLPHQLVSDTMLAWEFPQMVYRKGILHLAFEGFKNGSSGMFDIYYMRSSDLGVTWTVPCRLSVGKACYSVRMRPGPDDLLYVGWYDVRYNPPMGYVDVFFRRSTDAGFNWDTTVSITTDHKSCLGYLGLGCDSNDVYLLWPKEDTLYFIMSTDRGVTWGERTANSGGRNAGFQDASLAASTGRVHLFWRARRDTVSGIEAYYRRGIREYVGIAEGVSSFGAKSELVFAPSPFVHSVCIRVPRSGQRSGHCKLDIYDVGGRRVKTLDKLQGQGGYHEVVWDGVDDFGRKLPAGVYFVCLRDGASGVRRKVVRAK